jgi:cytochrome bd-type quinol oxidase subunit 2
MGKLIRHQAFMILAIGFICVAIFPFVFTYCISLLIQSAVSKQTAAKIDKFWDIVGKPYDYLIKAVE